MIRAKPSLSKWPKKPLPLTDEQIQISTDWMHYFHEINREKFSGFVDFGHKYVASRRLGSSLSTLEIGAGLGAQLAYETDSRNASYIGMERHWNMARGLKGNCHQISCCVADCEGLLPFKNGSMDRVIAIHVLEHLLDLPSCLRAVRDVLKPAGRFMVIIPCEAGFAYEIARSFTSKRLFEKRYKTSYTWHIKSEHVNTAKEILEELDHYFQVDETAYYPFYIPLIHLNAVIGLTLSQKTA